MPQACAASRRPDRVRPRGALPVPAGSWSEGAVCAAVLGMPASATSGWCGRATRTPGSSARTSPWSPTASAARPPVRSPRPPRRTPSPRRSCSARGSTPARRRRRGVRRRAGQRPARGPARPRPARHGHDAHRRGDRRTQRRARPRRRLARLPPARRASCARSPPTTPTSSTSSRRVGCRPRRAGHPPVAQRRAALRSTATRRASGLDITRLDVRVGDRLLICSDGLTDLVDDARIARGPARAGPRGRGGRR